MKKILFGQKKKKNKKKKVFGVQLQLSGSVIDVVK